MATKFKTEKLKNGNIRTCEVRLAYVNLLKPRAGKSDDGTTGKPKFGAALLFPKGADMALLKAEVEACAKEKWGAKYEAMKKANKIRLPFKLQEENVDDEGEVRSGFDTGQYYLSANANEDRKPPIIDGQMNTLTEANEVYSGMWARCSIRPFAYETSGNRGVAFGLQAVQKLWDDESLGGGGRVNVETEFEPLEIEEGASAESVFD